MPFEKGRKRTGGRAKGVVNKRTSQWEALVAHLEGSQTQAFTNYMNSLWLGTKADRATAANLYVKLLEFHKPKLARTEVKADVDKEVNYVIKFK